MDWHWSLRLPARYTVRGGGAGLFAEEGSKHVVELGEGDGGQQGAEGTQSPLMRGHTLVKVGKILVLSKEIILGFHFHCQVCAEKAVQYFSIVSRSGGKAG